MELKELDDIDRKILDHLTDNGRLNNAELGRMVNLTRAAVRDRVNSLVERGIIDKFTIIINPRKAGKPLSLYFNIDVKLEYMDAVVEYLQQDDAVTTVYQMSGRPHLHVHALLDDQEHIEVFMSRLRAVQGVVDLTAEILLSRLKERGSFLI
jgi:Lrp/AsnC family transcriptional regulator, leucine-responsive regulatory protein